MTTLAERLHDLTFNHDEWKKKAPPELRGAFVKAIEPEFMRLRLELRKARQFHFSDGFLQQVCQQASTNRNPKVMLERIPLARLPFDTIWIEFDGHLRGKFSSAACDAANGYKGGESDVPSGALEGYLISKDLFGWHATYVLSLPGDGVNVFAAGFRLGRPSESPAEIACRGWGYFEKGEFAKIMSLLEQGGTTGPKYLWNVLQQFQLKHSRTHKMNIDVPGAVDICTRETSGDIRFLVTALAMINCVPIKYVDRQPTATTGQKRPRQYMEQHTVEIVAGRTKVERLIDSSLKRASDEYTRKRAHEVRGFFRIIHRGTENEQRIWVRPHMRGDASIGFTRRTYEVTT